MIEIALFVIGIVVYEAYLFIEKASNKTDYDLLNAMNIISSSLKQGNSIETAMNDVSKGKDNASKIFKMIQKSFLMVVLVGKC